MRTGRPGGARSVATRRRGAGRADHCRYVASSRTVRRRYRAGAGSVGRGGTFGGGSFEGLVDPLSGDVGDPGGPAHVPAGVVEEAGEVVVVGGLAVRVEVRGVGPERG